MIYSLAQNDAAALLPDQAVMQTNLYQITVFLEKSEPSSFLLGKKKVQRSVKPFSHFARKQRE